MKTSTFLFSVLPAFLCASSVNAHGYVSFFGVDDTIYAGNSPGQNAKPSPIRQISTIDPVKGSDNTNLMCGQNAQPASMVVDANPGSKITFQWTDGPGNWPHNTGPFMTYMASCGSTTCDKFDPTNAKWFKIDEAGRKPNDPSGNWWQMDVMNGMSYSTKIPDSIASGQYLIRHEIIALHLAVTMGGAEFYPSCMQVNVGGSQVAVASSNELVSFPGAYSDSDPGIYDPNVYDPGSSYTFPGPPVAQMANGDASSDTTGPKITSATSGGGGGSGGSSAAGGSSTTPPGTPSASSPANTSTSVSGGGSSGNSNGSCSLKKRSKSNKRSKIPRPHTMSRIMNKLIHGKSF